MSADTIIKPDKETKAETKPGNYFVSNYPPFSFWKEEEVPMVESMLNSPTPEHLRSVFIIMFRFAGSVVISVTSECTPIKTLRMFVAIWTQQFANWKHTPIHLILQAGNQNLCILEEEPFLPFCSATYRAY